MAIGTLRQFEQAHRAKAVAEYGITGAEYDRFYPVGCRQGEWVLAIEEYVRDGNTLTRFEADALHAAGVPVVRFLRSYPHALPEAYLTPDVREMNNTREREMVAMRRRIREQFANV